MADYNRVAVVAHLAREFAWSRTGGDVFIDGSSDPTPTGYRRARVFLVFLAMLEAAGGVAPEVDEEN